MGRERLQKILAEAGVASRRACEELIVSGYVQVNGEVFDTLPAFADADTDDIRVHGRRVRIAPKTYIMMYKPKGYVTTAHDPQGRKTVMVLLGDMHMRLFPIGRLDRDTEGLLMLTNDGELAKRLTHPRYGVERVYRVHVQGEFTGEQSQKLRQGVWLSDGKAKAEHVKIIKRNRRESILELILTEGKNRQVRRMLARLEFPVKKLVRIRFGPIVLRGVKLGNYRYLEKSELAKLKEVLKSV